MNDDASKSTAFLDRYELRIIFMLVLVLALMALWRWTSPMTPSWAGIDIPHPLTASMSSGQASDAASTYWHSLVLLAAVGLGLLAGFHAMGLEVPGDVSVVGAVSAPTLGAMTVPALTTTHAPGEEIGRAAARALIAMLRNQADPADFHELVACAVVDGDSLGPAPQID